LSFHSQNQHHLAHYPAPHHHHHHHHLHHRHHPQQMLHIKRPMSQSSNSLSIDGNNNNNAANRFPPTSLLSPSTVAVTPTGPSDSVLKMKLRKVKSSMFAIYFIAAMNLPQNEWGVLSEPGRQLIEAFRRRNFCQKLVPYLHISRPGNLFYCVLPTIQLLVHAFHRERIIFRQLQIQTRLREILLMPGIGRLDWCAADILEKIA